MNEHTITDDVIREMAGKILHSHLEDVESLSIAEMMADDDRFKNLPEDDFDAAQKRIDNAISEATLTISWSGTSAIAVIGPAGSDTEAAWHTIRRYVGPDLFNAVDAELIETTHADECHHLPPWAVCWFNHEPHHSWWPVGLGTWRIRPVQWQIAEDDYQQSMEIQAWDEATQTWHDWDGPTVGEVEAAAEQVINQDPNKITAPVKADTQGDAGGRVTLRQRPLPDQLDYIAEQLSEIGPSDLGREAAAVRAAAAAVALGAIAAELRKIPAGEQ